MNGVHDLGGMHGMGPIRPETDEPVFHAPWEGRAYAITRAMGAWKQWTLDGSRAQRELLPPAQFFRLSYYEKWIAGLVELMVRTGLVTRAELASGKADPAAAVRTPPLTAEMVPILAARGVPARRDVPVPARFTVAQRVRARNIHPLGHTRLPRYARGKVGTVVRDHGVFVFPDSNAYLAGENPQHVYSVRFGATELWGDAASARDSVYVDLWDDYLEPA